MAAIQLEIKLDGSNQDRLNKIVAWIRRAASLGAELICLPELCVSGYQLDTDRIDEVAESIPGDSSRALQEVAAELGVYIAAGLAETDGERVYSSFFLVGPEGYLGKVRKHHAPPSEDPFYGLGDEFPVFEVGKCCVGINICMDNWFPETTRILGLQGAEVILMPFSWPSDWEAHWDGTSEQNAVLVARRARIMKVFPARALDNGVYLVMVDHVGQEGEDVPWHPGISVILDPNGEVVAETQGLQEEILIAELDSGVLEKWRSDPHFPPSMRRPEIYGRLVQG